VFDSNQDRRFPFDFYGRIFTSEGTERELRLLHLMTRGYMKPGFPEYCISWSSSVICVLPCRPNPAGTSAPHSSNKSFFITKFFAYVIRSSSTEVNKAAEIYSSS